jgi:truncated hemoglobin YjbI
MCGGEEKYTQSHGGENMRDHLENLGINRRITSKWILKK